MSEDLKVRWQSNIKQLITEQLENSHDQSGALVLPWKITYSKLLDVASVAARINDPELNLLMCELALYTVGDGYHEDYDPEIVEMVRSEAKEFKATSTKG